MKTVKSLLGQRMKWEVGTIEDLCSIGLNRLTCLDWWQQVAGLFAAFARVLWVLVIVGLIVTDQFRFILFWWILPLVFVAVDVKAAMRIPHRDKLDVLIAALIIPAEIFAWLWAAWFTKSWFDFVISKVTDKRKDRWAMQYKAEESVAMTG
jgi:predicted membrane protein